MCWIPATRMWSWVISTWSTSKTMMEPDVITWTSKSVWWIQHISMFLYPLPATTTWAGSGFPGWCSTKLMCSLSEMFFSSTGLSGPRTETSRLWAWRQRTSSQRILCSVCSPSTLWTSRDLSSRRIWGKSPRCQAGPLSWRPSSATSVWRRGTVQVECPTCTSPTRLVSICVSMELTSKARGLSV